MFFQIDFFEKSKNKYMKKVFENTKILYLRRTSKHRDSVINCFPLLISRISTVVNINNDVDLIFYQHINNWLHT